MMKATKSHGIVIEDLESRLLPSATLLGFLGVGLGGVSYSAGSIPPRPSPSVRNATRRPHDADEEQSTSQFELFPATRPPQASNHAAPSRTSIAVSEANFSSTTSALKAHVASMQTAVAPLPAIAAARSLFQASEGK